MPLCITDVNLYCPCHPGSRNLGQLTCTPPAALIAQGGFSTGLWFVESGTCVLRRIEKGKKATGAWGRRIVLIPYFPAEAHTGSCDIWQQHNVRG